jgi:hypothetical protein
VNMHLYTFIHASSFGRHTQKNRHKNNIKIYAYIFIHVYASFGRHPITVDKVLRDLTEINVEKEGPCLN